MLATFEPRLGDDVYLPANEIERRLAHAFPNCLINHEFINNRLRTRLIELIETETPLPIIQGLINCFGASTLVELYPDSLRRIAVCVSVEPDSQCEAYSKPLDANPSDEKVLRDLMLNIAEILDCNVEWRDIDQILRENSMLRQDLGIE